MQPFFFIHVRKKFIRIDISDIRYIMAVAHHVKLVTEHGIFLPHLSLKQIETILPPEHFTRVNRSTLVALDRVETYDRETVSLKEASFSFTDKCRKIFLKKIRVVVHEEGEKPPSGDG